MPPVDDLEEHQQLVRQMRDANEKLVLATVRAEQLAEEAERARRVAAESEERFRSLVLASSAIVWRADRQGTITFEPDAWLSFTGVQLRATEDWLDTVHPQDRDRVEARWRLALATSTLYECEHRLLRKTDGYAWVAARAVPIVRVGVAHEWIGMMSDISVRIELEIARERFMAILGHDLRSPLAAISISAQTLQLLHLEPPYGLLVEDIGAISMRMAALIQDVMDFARGRSSGIPLARTECDVRTLLEQQVSEHERAHPHRSISHTVTGDTSGQWDAGRLAQLMTNLLGNAIAHGQDPIVVSLVGDAEAITLSVANRGSVIPAEVLATLFEPFARAKARTSLASGGLGLGLYIVREIVRAHDGTIEVSSTSDETVVCVRLPREPRPRVGALPNVTPL